MVTLPWFGYAFPRSLESILQREGRAHLLCGYRMHRQARRRAFLGASRQTIWEDHFPLPHRTLVTVERPAMSGRNSGASAASKLFRSAHRPGCAAVHDPAALRLIETSSCEKMRLCSSLPSLETLQKKPPSSSRRTSESRPIFSSARKFSSVTSGPL